MQTRAIAIAVAALLLALPAAGQEVSRGIDVVQKEAAADDPIGGTYRALLIGINAYTSDRWPSLNTAVRDVERIAEVLVTRYGFAPENVRVLTDATRREMIRGFIELANASQEPDNVLIYYAGHGEYDDGGRGFWIPSNASDQADYVSNDEILGQIRSIPARHKLLIADSCFSGNLLTRGGGRPPGSDAANNRYVREKSKLVSVQGLSSGGNEPVSDGGAEWNGHSIFAYHLAGVLAANQKPFLSATELGFRVTEVVANDTTTVFGTGQTPVFSPIRNQGDQGGEFFFRPRDVAPLRNKPVAVVRLQLDDPAADAALSRAWAVLSGALAERLTENGFEPVGAPAQVAADGLDRHAAAALAENGVSSLLVVTLRGSRRPDQTAVWQGLADLELNVRAVTNDNGKLTTVAAGDLPQQTMPTREWRDSPEAAAEHYAQAAAKVIRKWPTREFDGLMDRFYKRAQP